jgi:hypothetical protein
MKFDDIKGPTPASSRALTEELAKDYLPRIGSPADFSASGEPSALSDPIRWRVWWLAKNPSKTWADAGAAWQVQVS